MTDSQQKKEKPFNIYSWDDLREELRTMKPRSKLFEIVKSEMTKRGHWKNKPRGLDSQALNNL